MSGLAARNGGRIGLAAMAAILLLGLVLRVDYAWEGREPVFDAAAYGQIAANLERGEGFTLGDSATQPASNYSPGLPLLLAGLYEASGAEHVRFARIVLALLGTLAVLFTYLIGRRLSGPLAGLIGAVAVAIYPALLEYQGMLMSEPLAATLLSGALLSMFWAAGPTPTASGADGAGERGSRTARPSAPPFPDDRIRAPRWLVPGLLLGALALVRPEYLGVAFLLALVVLVLRLSDGWGRSLAQAGVLVLGVVLVVAPWTVRNAIELDRFATISTGGGQVLFAGSYMPSDGDPERVGREVLERHPGLTRKLAEAYRIPSRPAKPGIYGEFVPHRGRNSPSVEAVLARVRLEQILAALAAQRYPGLATDRALARMGRERLWEEISEQPLDYVGFVARKVGRIWSHGPRAVMKTPAWELLHWALVAFGLVGLVVLARQRRWEAIPLLTVLLAITALSAILVASPRRVLVMLPLVAALAGVGMTACGDSLARRWKH